MAIDIKTTLEDTQCFPIAVGVLIGAQRQQVPNTETYNVYIDEICYDFNLYAELKTV